MNDCPYCQNSFDMAETCADEFRMWQGLIGPYYIPSIDEDGILSWTNTGELPNPSPVNITGKGLTIGGIVESAQELPESADDYVTYLVGEEEPYNGYMWDGSEWVDLGVIGRGEKGDQGDPGIGIPASGTTGQVLAKKSNTDYDTEWVNQSGGADPATATPLMDGTAAVGTATKYAREDHVHPTDTSRASATDLTNLSGAFKAFTITLSSSGWSSNAQTVSDAKFIASGYSYIVSPASSSFAAYGEAQIYADDVSTDGSMTFHCTSVPSSNLTVNVVRVVAT